MTNDYHRYCPGEEQIHISDAICLGRRRANFGKCPGCQFNDDERGAAPFEATVVGQRNRPAPPITESEERMIERVFKAYDVRGVTPEPLSEAVAWRIGNATAQFLRSSLSGYDRSDAEMNKLIIGRDMRLSSPGLRATFIEGARAAGAPIVDIGLIDTPQMTFATNTLKCCGGVVVTASHNPENYNGFKIFGQKGRPIGVDTGLLEIERIARVISRHKVYGQDAVQTLDLSGPYREFLRRFLRPGRPLKAVIDASNGMAGRWFPLVLAGAPNLSVIELNFEHAGRFHHPPDPLRPANLVELQQAVRSNGADFGACFDGDADRCIFVDEHGEIVPCDLLTALLAEEFLREHTGGAVVYDLRSSRVVRERILAAGGRPRRQRVGHVFMKRAMAEENAVFGGELSGHFYFRDFWYCDSGLLAFIFVLNTLSRGAPSLGQLVRPLRKYAASGELNFQVDDKDRVLRELERRCADARVDRLDGLTVEYDDWWFNLRPSNTEPLLRLNVEAMDHELLERRLGELSPLIGARKE